MVQTQLPLLNPANPHSHHHHRWNIKKKKIGHPTQKPKLLLAATPKTPNPPISSQPNKPTQPPPEC